MNIIKSIILIPLIVILFFSSCSYQKMNSVSQKKFDIQEFEIEGGARESHTLPGRRKVSDSEKWLRNWQLLKH